MIGRLCIISFLLLVGSYGFGQKVSSDTLGFWYVHLNDSLIGQYNTLSTDNRMIFKRNLINSSDTIFIKYNNNPCPKCEYYYSAQDIPEGIKLHVERKNQLLGKIPFPLDRIKAFKRSTEFEFSIYKNSYVDDNNIFTILFKLKLEE